MARPSAKRVVPLRSMKESDPRVRQASGAIEGALVYSDGRRRRRKAHSHRSDFLSSVTHSKGGCTTGGERGEPGLCRLAYGDHHAGGDGILALDWSVARGVSF